MLDPISEFVPSAPSQHTPGRELDKDAFLQLLTAQLRHQDPLDPSSQEEMFGTLSQMSLVEQMEELNSNVSSMLQMNNLGLIGLNVKALNAEGNVVEGLAQGVVYQADGPMVDIGGELTPVSDIISAEIPR